MEKIEYKADERGYANHGWLEARHSFSFAGWYDPDKINFGVLRVLNDDKVAPKMGFGQHPHDNMEIITIPLEGEIKHQDSMGNSSIIKAGEIQVMSAGSGVMHSEFNPSKDVPLKLFQIWIFPNKHNVEPRYDQFKMDVTAMQNNFLQLVSPNQDDEGTWIHQNAYIHMAIIEEEKTLTYTLKDPNNGVYLMVVEGKTEIADSTLNDRDALGVWDTKSVTLKALTNSRILAIEVPLQLN